MKILKKSLGGENMEIIDETYSIKEASEIVGFKPHVIRYYEKEFELDIPRTESNRRVFSYKELEEFRYIKTLKNKGLTNKQIKQILKSPEIKLDDNYNPDIFAETAVSDLIVGENLYPSKLTDQDLYNVFNDIFNYIQNIDYEECFEELNMKIDELQNQIINQERDVLICENAKLKMKVKEKSYELAELKDKLRREENKKTSILAKIFGQR